VNNLAESNLEGNAYFAQVKRNFAAYKKHLIKKNDMLRQTNTRKSHQMGGPN